MKTTNVKLILENGVVFNGNGFGYICKSLNVGLVVFNTSIVGIEETITDKSYNQELICFTFPQQGIYGINKNNLESSKIQCCGIIINNLINYDKYNFLNKNITSLNNFLLKHKIPGIYNINTRNLSKIIRENGSLKGVIVPSDFINNDVISKLKLTKLKNQTDYVTSKTIKIINSEFKKCIVLYDFGYKKLIIKELTNRKFKIIVVPKTTPFKYLEKFKYDAIFLSNGPGNPNELGVEVKNIKQMLKNNKKIIGICLGMQLISLVHNCKINKLKFGHHGINHPVINVKTKKSYITTHNHNYVVSHLPKNSNLKKSFVSLYDKSIEGIYNENIFAIQFHPEAGPGTSDANYIFNLIEKHIFKK